MTHADRVQKLPEGFEVIGVSENSPYAGIADEKREYMRFSFTQRFTTQKRGQNYLKTLQKISVAVKAHGIWEVLQKRR